MASVAPLRFQRLSWCQHVHAHDGRDVRLLQVGEHHGSALDDIGPKIRSVDASAGQPVASSDVDKTAILSTFAGVLSTFQAPPNPPLPQ